MSVVEAYAIFLLRISLLSLSDESNNIRNACHGNAVGSGAFLTWSWMLLSVTPSMKPSLTDFWEVKDWKATMFFLCFTMGSCFPLNQDSPNQDYCQRKRETHQEKVEYIDWITGSSWRTWMTWRKALWPKMKLMWWATLAQLGSERNKLRMLECTEGLHLEVPVRITLWQD